MLDLPIFYTPDISKDSFLPELEAQHCLRVLRLGIGDEVMLTDGKSSFFEAQIVEANKKKCRVEVIKTIPWSKTWHGHFTLAVTPTKSIDRMEWLIEKAVELGVDELVCLKTKHSERKHIKAERLEKIMLSAMKQSQKAVLPKLQVGLPLAEALERFRSSQMFIAHCREAVDGLSLRKEMMELYQKEAKAYTIFIGPEGDFSHEEILLAESLGAKPISLGASRLRTETAGFVALNNLHLLERINLK